MSASFIFTSESVSEGHPDKVCDAIADAVLDAHLAQDPESLVACEVLCKDDHVVLAGEIESSATVDAEAVTREAIRNIGYTDPQARFHAAGVQVINLLGGQSAQIRQGVRRDQEIGAGDQGLVFGYATVETPELMPLPITLAHRLVHSLAEARKSGEVSWLLPDAKSQVSVRYVKGEPREVTDVIVSTQHSTGFSQERIHDYVATRLLPQALGDWHHQDIHLRVNPTGAFSIGGPEGDCGVTGRKIIVDTYGGFSRHGGGAFSGKDPTKVDRIAAYFARYVARQIVLRGLARRVELQLSYAIGLADPVSLYVNTFGTGDASIAESFARRFDFRPAAIIERLNLRRPIYGATTNYGHFGKPNLEWER
jgi:S-adenosylmethionine synthetase